MKTGQLLNRHHTCLDERQITHLICARLKYDLYDFSRGCVWACFLFFFLYKRPQTHRAQIRWVIWRSSTTVRVSAHVVLHASRQAHGISSLFLCLSSCHPCLGVGPRPQQRQKKGSRPVSNKGLTTGACTGKWRNTTSRVRLVAH